MHVRLSIFNLDGTAVEGDSHSQGRSCNSQPICPREIAARTLRLEGVVFVMLSGWCPLYIGTSAGVYWTRGAVVLVPSCRVGDRGRRAVHRQSSSAPGSQSRSDFPLHSTDSHSPTSRVITTLILGGSMHHQTFLHVIETEHPGSS